MVRVRRDTRPVRWTSGLLLSLGLLGCGHTIIVGPTRTVTVALSEYRLNPQAISARAGRLTITAHNFGRLTHNLVVSLSGRWKGSIGPLAPGRSGQLTLTLAPGSYALSSVMGPDHALGLYGTLTVSR